MDSGHHRRGSKRLRLLVSHATYLLKGDIFGLSDPYVKVTVEGPAGEIERHKTYTVKKSLNPHWKQLLDFWVRENQFSVILDVYDENILIRDDFLGRAILHFDFSSTDPDRRPPTTSSRLESYSDVQSAAKKYVSLLRDKYDGDLLNEYTYMRHVRSMNDHFFHKRLHQHPRHLARRSRGSLTVYAIFESMDAVVTEFEQVPSPTQPATRQGGAAATLGLDALFQEEGSESDTEEELPEGWEAREDSNRRQLFVNHRTRAVSLRRPRRSDPPTEVAPPTRPRQFLNRVESIEAIEEEEEEEEEAEDQPPSATAGLRLDTYESSLDVQTALDTAPSAPPIPAPAPQPQAEASVGASPQFSSAIQRASQGLPLGWEAGITPNGRIYYIDHRTHTTTWEKPRVQERRPVAQERGARPGPVEQDVDLPDGWEQRKTADGRTYYVDHNSRITTWEHPGMQQNKEKQELGPLPPGWEMKQMPDGRMFYVDHNTHSTQWEDPRLLAKNKPTTRIQYSRDYKQKYTNFRFKLKPKHHIPNTFEFTVRRTHIFEDSYNVIMNVRDVERLKARLYMTFQGETGYDFGGLSREWFYLLSHEMFSPYYGLFEYSASDDYTLQISPDSGVYNEHHLDYFKFIGRVCGMAVYHNRLIDAFFIRPFYKMMLNKPVTLDDMQSVDVELYNSIMYILENDPEPLCLDFSVNKTLLGELLVVDLKPGGRDIPLTEKNKKEYIDLLIKWRFADRVRQQMDAFLKGFSDLIPQHLLKVFDERELEYLMGGLSQIDVEDWKRNSEYVGYAARDDVIIWFWKAVENYDSEMRARLLQFVTGTSKVPMNGFAELQGSQGPRKFCIKRYGTPTSLPRAHTCFNRVDLPPYQSYHKLKENLRLAVENTEGFEGVD